MAYSLNDPKYGWLNVSQMQDPTQWLGTTFTPDQAKADIYKALGISTPAPTVRSINPDMGWQYDTSGLPDLYRGYDPSSGQQIWSAFDRNGNQVGNPYSWSDSGFDPLSAAILAAGAGVTGAGLMGYLPGGAAAGETALGSGAIDLLPVGAPGVSADGIAGMGSLSGIGGGAGAGAIDAMGGSAGVLGAADSSLASSQLGLTAADVGGGIPSAVDFSGIGTGAASGLGTAATPSLWQQASDWLHSPVGNALRSVLPGGQGNQGGQGQGGNDGLSYGGLLGSLLGGAAGLSSSGNQQQTQQNKIDPRMEPYIYGPNGILNAAQTWFNQNKGGNALMNQGAQMQADYYTSPQYAQNFQRLSDMGMGLLNSGVAGNPFSNGQASLGAQGGLLNSPLPMPHVVPPMTTMPVPRGPFSI
jgi:hypothetical protein